MQISDEVYEAMFQQIDPVCLHYGVRVAVPVLLTMMFKLLEMEADPHASKLMVKWIREACDLWESGNFPVH
jgi:hypothetical protein